jgi:hypothetical protein
MIDGVQPCAAQQNIPSRVIEAVSACSIVEGVARLLYLLVIDLGPTDELRKRLEQRLAERR